MLHFRIADEVVKVDVDAEFEKITISDGPIVRKIFEKLECGTFLTPRYFCDRFGYRISISNLSTGCKAALLTVFRPDMEINLNECGYNAIGCILNYVTEGSIVVSKNICFASVYYDDDDLQCDVALNGYRFTDISKLNDYITDYYPAPLPYLYNGIEELEPHDLSCFKEVFCQPSFPPLGTRITDS